MYIRFERKHLATYLQKLELEKKLFFLSATDYTLEDYTLEDIDERIKISVRVSFFKYCHRVTISSMKGKKNETLALTYSCFKKFAPTGLVF